MLLNLSSLAIPLAIKEATATRWRAVDQQSGAVIYFATLSELLAWLGKEGQ